LPLDPFAAHKATGKPELKAARRGTCAVCGAQKTVYPVRIFPEGLPWENALLCSDCIGRLQREQLWPLPPA
jgi:hypothetical protein